MNALLTSLRSTYSYAISQTDGQKHASTAALCEIASFGWIPIVTDMQQMPVRHILEGLRLVRLNAVGSAVTSCRTKESGRELWASLTRGLVRADIRFALGVNSICDVSTLDPRWINSLALQT